MKDLSSHIAELRQMFRQEEKSTAESARVHGGLADEISAASQRYIEKYIREQILRYPYYHARHFTRLEAFNGIARFEQSVFIMTKFPDGNDALSQQLDVVIRQVEKAVAAVRYDGRDSYVPRIARGPHSQFHDLLWDNVELHTLGCARGIAIVEDKYRPELNPNVAMEWGFMRAMGRPVLFLMEQSFKHRRADWEGLITSKFSWEEPEATIPAAIAEHFRTHVVR